MAGRQTLFPSPGNSFAYASDTWVISHYIDFSDCSQSVKLSLCMFARLGSYLFSHRVFNVCYQYDQWLCYKDNLLSPDNYLLKKKTTPKIFTSRNVSLLLTWDEKINIQNGWLNFFPCVYPSRMNELLWNISEWFSLCI